ISSRAAYGWLGVVIDSISSDCGNVKSSDYLCAGCEWGRSGDRFARYPVHAKTARWTSTPVVRLGPIPDQRLRRDIDLPGPCDGIAVHEGRFKQFAALAERLEDTATNKILDVTLDDIPVGQGEPKPVPAEHLDRGDVKHGSILLQRLDRQEALRPPRPGA